MMGTAPLVVMIGRICPELSELESRERQAKEADILVYRFANTTGILCASCLASVSSVVCSIVAEVAAVVMKSVS